uniref:Uncharacterized protein n=1 Tax=Leersia perrieri TaxID=77586 RepID=A0A0D9WSW9_9ORYZ
MTCRMHRIEEPRGFISHTTPKRKFEKSRCGTKGAHGSLPPERSWSQLLCAWPAAAAAATLSLDYLERRRARSSEEETKKRKGMRRETWRCAGAATLRGLRVC